MAGKHYVFSYIVFCLSLGIVPVWAFADYSIDITTATSDGLPIGHGTNRKEAQSFTTSSTDDVSSVEFATHWNASDPTPMTITVTLHADSGGSPAGTALATTTGTVGNQNCSDTRDVATFATPVTGITASTTYWIVREGVPTAGGSNYYRGCQSYANPYTGGGTKYWNGSAWGSFSNDDNNMKINFTTPTGGGGGGEATTTATTTPLGVMHFETFSTVFYALSIAMAAYFALFVFRFFTG